MHDFSLQNTFIKRFLVILGYCIFSTQVITCFVLVGCARNSDKVELEKQQKTREQDITKKSYTHTSNKTTHQQTSFSNSDEKVGNTRSTNETAFQEGNSHSNSTASPSDKIEENSDPNRTECQDDTRENVVKSMLRRSNRSGLPIEKLTPEEVRRRGKQLLNIATQCEDGMASERSKRRRKKRTRFMERDSRSRSA